MKLFFCAAHLLALCFSPVFSWDIGVAVGNQLQFLSKDGKLLGIAAEKYTDMAAMTFDPLHNHIYFSDSKDSQFSIFRLKLDNSSESKIIQPIVSRRHDDKEVQGVAFDAVTLSLFWSTGVGRTIQRLKLLSLFTAQPQEGETILQLDDQVPQGLAIDSCNRKLYWTNCNHKLATIESSDLDGQNKIRIVNEDLWQPLGITVDQHHQKLYWSDEQESFGFKIERSDLDGKNRETLITGSHHQPVALAIDLNFVYWSDWVHHAIWRSNLSIVNDIDLQPEQFRLYNNKIPNGVVSRTDLNYISKDSCPVLLELKRKVGPHN